MEDEERGRARGAGNPWDLFTDPLLAHRVALGKTLHSTWATEHLPTIKVKSQEPHSVRKNKSNTLASEVLHELEWRERENGGVRKNCCVQMKCQTINTDSCITYVHLRNVLCK